jgi:hypothetical protein
MCLAHTANYSSDQRDSPAPRPPQKHDDRPSGSSGDNNNNNNNNKDDDDDKLSSLLVKAFLWMLTAYMFIAVVSLIFPGTNQPEVNQQDYPFI